MSRIKYWLDRGASPSKSVTGLLKQGGILKLESPYSQASKLGQPVVSESTKPVQAESRRKSIPKTRNATRHDTAPKAKPHSK